MGKDEREVRTTSLSREIGVEVRWRDVDVLGHVNNAVYFTYFEIARVAYLERAFPDRDFEIHLASVRCDFLTPIRHGDAVVAGVGVPWLGRTSFGFEYEIGIRGEPSRLAARGKSVQVLFERGGGRKRVITPSWVAAIAVVEGRVPGPRQEGATRS